MDVPVRLCCGQAHWGVVCPDDMVLCCICFDRFPKDDLYVDGNGDRWDMCHPCGADEEASRLAPGQ